MPLNTSEAMKVWYRYAWCRDNGHNQFVDKADLCDRFFRGDQWSATDLQTLRRQRRPALTINKILSTLANVMGEQIFNRNEISYRPRRKDSAETATVLTKVFKQISDRNQLDWKRSDMFADGAITSRGFLDVRMEFDKNMQGDVVIENLNPKNVIVDPDAEQYDPDTWNEVFTTKWMTADDIVLLYGKTDGEALRNREQSFFPYGYDSIQSTRDRFGDRFNPAYPGPFDQSSVQRNMRVIERQYRTLDRQKHFFAPQTGDMREIPKEFGRDKIAWFVEKYGFQVIPRLVHRIKWIVVCDNFVLKDEWSPYKHFTVVPYFPYFRHGKTIGLVENLIGPQELLNKTSSQELHVINTTANSGWKIRAGSLVNMSTEELEQRGAETGLVIEVSGDVDKDIQKITPNTVPTGLDRVTYKAEEHIKTISGVSDSMQGHDREDVAAKAIQAKRQAGSTNLAKPLDALVRTDFILARNVLDLVQEFYSEERVMTITKDRITGDTETFTINEMSPEGHVANDLTLGEYDVVIGSVPQRETLEDSQFDQAVALRELGVEIPDEVLIDASRLVDKKGVIEKMRAGQDSPEAQAQRELQRRGMEAEVGKTEAEIAQKHADAGLKQAKAMKEGVAAKKEAITPPEDNGIGVKLMTAQADIDINERKFEQEASLAERKADLDERIKLREAEQDAHLKEEQAATERMLRVQNANNPQPQGQTQ
ncbi:MAG TPA: hypothetical protein PK861_00020 [Thermomonas sp.]|nr:hypothetical protein [Thermomonas sp.]